jgi:hypothetical protein
MVRPEEVNPLNGQYSYKTAGDGPSDYNMPPKPKQPGVTVDPNNCNANGTLSWTPGNNSMMAPDLNIGKSIGGLSGSLADKVGPFRPSDGDLDDLDPGTADGQSPKTNV